MGENSKVFKENFKSKIIRRFVTRCFHFDDCEDIISKKSHVTRKSSSSPESDLMIAASKHFSSAHKVQL